jgi:molybdopterin molybdotransferase
MSKHDDGFAMTAAEARAIARAQLAPVGTIETIGVAEARNRVLAADLTAGIDLPPHDGAAVDGFAIRFADLSPAGNRELRLTGLAAAGHPFQEELGHRQAVRIFTGALIPRGADTVVMQEYCQVEGGAVTIPPEVRRGQNWRRRAEDVRAGTIALSAGQRLRAQDIALAAALGHGELAVFARLRVALFSTGDEVREPGQPRRPGEIWDANRWLLRSLLEEFGCRVSDLGILPDHPRAIEEALSAAAPEHDLLVTSGGMSVGAEDHLGAVIRRRGTLDIWRLALKPGKPVGLGDIDACPVLALPGNPVAALVTFIALGRAIVLRLAGASDEPPLSFRLPIASAQRKKPGREEYLFANIVESLGATSAVAVLEKQGTAMLSGVIQAHGFVILGEEATEVAKCELVTFIPLRHLIG